jgi:(4-(4-[2-(gamma-L-glutamylamino)ethyl]phenoxymethyl)furan-2-yl)methanamine synthase
VLSGSTLSREAPVIAAGAGRHLAGRVAERLGRRWVDFDAVLPRAEGVEVGQCAPAAAVALLFGAGARS